MHLITKQIKGHEYFYLVEKERRGNRVVTARTVYVGNRQKLANLVQQSVSAALPRSFEPQPVGAVLALARLADELGLESIIDEVCPVRQGAAPIGRRLIIAAIGRAIMPRSENGLVNLRAFYDGSVLPEVLPVDSSALDDRRLYEVLVGLSDKEIEEIESAVVRRVVNREGVSTNALAFDCTNFDSYAGAKTPSRLLRRGHAKSGRPLRVLGLGLLASQDEGMPLLTFVYPGNENDVRAFGRFLRALDRRRESLDLPLDTTIAADGGNISKQLLLELEQDPRYYVMRLPAHHLTDLERCKRRELPPLVGALAGKVWAKKYRCSVYGTERSVVDVYSRRMHQRQLPGLHRDRNRARAELLELQRLLDRQRQGLRHAKPITLRSLRRRVEAALSREHMSSLFRVTLAKGAAAPTLRFEEPPEAWQELDDYVLGRTLLITNRTEWAPEQVVSASRVQSHNEHLFRDIKDPGGVSMLPLRHRRDRALRGHALVVVLGVTLAKLLQRRVKKAGLKAPSIKSVLKPLKQVQRARLHFPPTAAPALRALAANTWIPSERTERQTELLGALNLADQPELGTTLAERLARKKPGPKPRSVE